MFFHSDSEFQLFTDLEIARLPSTGVVLSRISLEKIFNSIGRLLEYKSLNYVSVVLRSKDPVLLKENFHKFLEHEIHLNYGESVPDMFIMGIYLTRRDEHEIHFDIITKNSLFVKQLISDKIEPNLKHVNEQNIGFEIFVDSVSEYIIKDDLSYLLGLYESMRGFFVAEHTGIEMVVRGNKQKALSKFKHEKEFGKLWAVTRDKLGVNSPVPDENGNIVHTPDGYVGAIGD